MAMTQNPWKIGEYTVHSGLCLFNTLFLPSRRNWAESRAVSALRSFTIRILLSAPFSLLDLRNPEPHLPRMCQSRIHSTNTVEQPGPEYTGAEMRGRHLALEARAVEGEIRHLHTQQPPWEMCILRETRTRT